MLWCKEIAFCDLWFQWVDIVVELCLLVWEVESIQVFYKEIEIDCIFKQG